MQALGTLAGAAISLVGVLVALILLAGEIRSRRDARAAQARLISVGLSDATIDGGYLKRVRATVSNDSAAIIRRAVVTLSLDPRMRSA
jgi:hypothetical protein